MPSSTRSAPAISEAIDDPVGRGIRIVEGREPTADSQRQISKILRKQAGQDTGVPWWYARKKKDDAKKDDAKDVKGAKDAPKEDEKKNPEEKGSKDKKKGKGALKGVVEQLNDALKN